MKVVILSIFFLLMPSVFIFSSELSEEIFIENESNRFNFGLILKSKTKFGALVLRHYLEGYIDLNYRIQIVNNTKLVLKKAYINGVKMYIDGVSAIMQPINVHFIDGVNYLNFDMSLFSDGETIKKIRKLAEINGIDVYVECFDEINNEEKKYSFKVSRENSMCFYNAFDMILHKQDRFLMKKIFLGYYQFVFFSFLFVYKKENNVIYNKIVQKSGDTVFIDETFTYLFKDGNLKELVFIKSDFKLSKSEHEKNMNATGYLPDAYRAMRPGYKFDFIFHDNKILGFKSVIFEGFEDAQVSRHENSIPSEKWQKLKDYNIGDPNVNEKFFHLKFPFVVKNTLSVTISKRFFKKIKKLKRLKIILISNEDRKYKIDIENFLLKYNL